MRGFRNGRVGNEKALVPRLLICLLVRSLLGVHGVADAADGYDVAENVVYAEVHGIGLLADVFTPSNDKNGAAIVEVASGAWSSDRGKIRDLTKARVFEILCDRGYVVFAIRPGSISKFSAAEMVANVERGITWAKSHADSHGFDKKRVGIMGASAGGHLASLTALANGRITGDDDASVAAAGVFFPPTDFTNYGGVKLDPRQENRLGQFVRRLGFPEGVDGLDDEAVEQRLAKISPARQVSETAPPFLLIHGTADFMVPLQQSEVMLAALQEKQVPAELIIKQGGGHPWPTVHEEVAVMADWFDQQLKSSE